MIRASAIKQSHFIGVLFHMRLRPRASRRYGAAAGPVRLCPLLQPTGKTPQTLAKDAVFES